VDVTILKKPKWSNPWMRKVWSWTSKSWW